MDEESRNRSEKMHMGDTSANRGGKRWGIMDGVGTNLTMDETRGQKNTSRVKKLLLVYLAGFFLGAGGVTLSRALGEINPSCHPNVPLFLIQQIIRENLWGFLVWGLPIFLALAYLITAPVLRRGRGLLLWVAYLGMNLVVPLLLIWISRMVGSFEAGLFGDILDLFKFAWQIGGNHIVAILAALYLWAYNQSPAGHPEAATGRGQWCQWYLAPTDRLEVMWTVFKVSLILLMTNWILIDWASSLCLDLCSRFGCLVGDWSWVITAGTGILALVLGVGMPVFACLKWWVEPRTRALSGASPGRPARVRLRRAWIVLGATTGCGVLIITLAGSFYDFQGTIAWLSGLLLFLVAGVLPLALILQKYEPSEGKKNAGQT